MEEGEGPAAGWDHTLTMCRDENWLKRNQRINLALTCWRSATGSNSYASFLFSNTSNLNTSGKQLNHLITLIDFFEQDVTKSRQSKCAVNKSDEGGDSIKHWDPGFADRTLKCSDKTPPRSNIYTTLCHFSSIFPMIADKASGYFSDSLLR